MYTGSRVLVVDDEPLIASLVADWLIELGCEVVGPEHTAPAALRSATETRPHVALLDVSLGADDGFTLADAFTTMGIPFAFMTGRDVQSLPDRHRGRPVLAKPFDFATIEGLLGTLLRGGTGRPPTAPG